MTAGNSGNSLHPLLTIPLAERFAGITLKHLSREYPNKLDHVMASAADVGSPRELHPCFYGSFDWHSCVHGFWQLARLIRLFPYLQQLHEVIDVFDARITPKNVQAETAYMCRPESKGFERPYGWAWLLMLASELKGHPLAEAGKWGLALSPLASLIATRWLEFLPRAIYPIRVGTHPNTAFALTLTNEYAMTHEDEVLRQIIVRKARHWYWNDVDCQAWEPSLDEFLSPALMEAEFMRRMLSATDFVTWLTRFLPGLRNESPVTLFQPATVSDRTDGKIAHLDGLNLSRAWCLRGLAKSLSPDDPFRARLEAIATQHLESALPHLATDYAGEHWLATFAMLALT